MKDLVISFLVVITLIGSWLIFDSYSQSQVKEMNYIINEEIIPAVESEVWQFGNEELKTLERKWHKYKKTAHLFLGASDLNEIDYGMSKAIEYAEAEDVSNTAGELSALSEQLTFLNSHEKITLGNIF